MLVTRFYHFSDKYRAGDGDVSRDYLVARHIVYYGARPWVGPWTSVSDSLRNSPAYYYLLAPFLLLDDDILTLGVVNAGLQIIGLTLAVVIVLEMGSLPVAIVFSIFTLTNHHILDQVYFSWQPHWANSLLLISWFLLWRGYRNAQFSLTVAGATLWVLSAAVHMSILLTLPFFLFCVLVSVKKQRTNERVVWLATAVLSWMAFILFLPVVIWWAGPYRYYIPSGLPITFPTMFGASFVRHLAAFLSIFYASKNIIVITVMAISGCITMVAAAHFFRRQELGSKQVFLLAAAMIVQYALAASLFDGQVRTHFYLPAAVPFLILISLVVVEDIEARRSRGIALFALCVWIFSRSFFHFGYWQSDVSATRVGDMTKSILREVEKKTPQFSVRLYVRGTGETASDSVVWASLEHRMKKPFVRIVNYGNSYVSLNNGGDTFVICQEYYSAQNECTSSYEAKYRPQKIKEKMYEKNAYTVYVY